MTKKEQDLNLDNVKITIERFTGGMYENMVLNFDGGITSVEFAEKLKMLMLWMTYSEKTIKDVFSEAGK